MAIASYNATQIKRERFSLNWSEAKVHWLLLFTCKDGKICPIESVSSDIRIAVGNNRYKSTLVKRIHYGAIPFEQFRGVGAFNCRINKTVSPIDGVDVRPAPPLRMPISLWPITARGVKKYNHSALRRGTHCPHLNTNAMRSRTHP